MSELPRLLTLEEVADLLRTTVPTVRHWIREGRLRTVKPGRRVLVPYDAVSELIGTPRPEAPAGS